MDAPNLRDQMPNTKMSQMLCKFDNVQTSISLIFQQPPPLMACDSHVGIQNFQCKSFRDIFLGSPNSSIIEQDNLALSSQVNNTGGIFSLKYLFNDPGAWAWANSTLREHH